MLGAQRLPPSVVRSCIKMIITENICCPYCGERFESIIDTSAGDQTYIDDCYVCCKPIVFQLLVSPDGELKEVMVKRDDD